MNAPLIADFPRAQEREQIQRSTVEERSSRLPFPAAAEELDQCHTISPWALSNGRRLFDFCTALFALILFSPVMLIAALLVWLGSPGPILFRQRRMGRNGCEFMVYKFRSMRVESSSARPITVSGDNRITRVGAFLRRYKLDELPQFVNVLRGDMSLVGPRPKLPHHEGLHMPFRPGITGAATIAFRCEEEMLADIPISQIDEFYELWVKPCKARLDWDYMRRATFRSDLELLWNTAASCICRRQANTVTDLTEIFPQPGD